MRNGLRYRRDKVAKYIRFEKEPSQFAELIGGEGYSVINKRSDGLIARIEWHKPWRKWVVCFDANSIWSEDCLQDIREFILSIPEG